VALQRVGDQKGAQAKAEEFLSSLPNTDFALPEGGSIHVSLGGKLAKPVNAKSGGGPSGAAAAPASGGGGAKPKSKPLALAPPPEAGSKGGHRKPASSGASGGGGGGGNLNPAPEGQPAPSAAAAAKPAAAQASEADPFALDPNVFGNFQSAPAPMDGPSGGGGGGSANSKSAANNGGGGKPYVPSGWVDFS